MIYHVLPGDSLREEFKKTGIDGDVIVCRECLVVGPADAETPFEFWDQRARYILAAYGEDEIEFHERVADELERLSDLTDDPEVNLWFEYELFCSVNMWFCISLLASAGARVYRVQPSVLTEEDRWKGFGSLDESELKKCFAERVPFTGDDIRLGQDLWDAYRKNDLERMRTLGQTVSNCFPYLAEVCEAAIEMDTRPAEILAEIEFEGKKGLEEIFPEFSKRAGVYGFGDLQVEQLMDKDDL